jgi:hypothetical protein
MKIIKNINLYKKSVKFDEMYDVFDDDTIKNYRDYVTNKNDFEVIERDDVREDLPVVDISNIEQYLADSYGDETATELEQQQQDEEFNQKMQFPYDVPEENKEAPEFRNNNEAISWAIQNNKKVRIDYVTKKGISISRDVDPHLMFRANNGNIILVTYDNTVGEIRAFIVENILNVIVTDDDFEKRMRVMPDKIKGNKTMDITESLKEISQSLRGRGLQKSASVIDDSLKAIKTAQYVGVQGYWIRNRRCWDNCYRQKRTKSPKTPAQEVWSQCWEEYLQSINNPNSGWEKYAGKESKKNNTEWNKYFYNIVSAKILKGMDIPTAVYDTLDREAHKQETVVLKEASTLAELSVALKEAGGFDEISYTLAKVANEVIKTNQFTGGWASFFDLFRTKRGKIAERLARIINRINDVQVMLQGAPQFWSSYHNINPDRPVQSESAQPSAQSPARSSAVSKDRIKKSQTEGVSGGMKGNIASKYHEFVSDARKEIGFLRKYVLKNPDLNPVIEPIVSSLAQFVNTSDEIYTSHGKAFEKNKVGQALGTLLSNLAGVRRDLGDPIDQKDVGAAEESSGVDLNQDSVVGQPGNSPGSWTSGSGVGQAASENAVPSQQLTIEQLKNMNREDIRGVARSMIEGKMLTPEQAKNIEYGFRVVRNSKYEDRNRQNT